MIEVRARAGASPWLRLLSDLGVELGDALVAGERAEQLADALEEAGGVPPASRSVAGADLVALGVDLGPAAEVRATGLSDASLDLVVLRHAVSDPPSLVAALREAYRVLRPGGTLLAADVSLESIMRSTPYRYPVHLLYSMFPDLLPLERRRHIGSTELGVEGVRAGFRGVEAYQIDDEFGEFLPDDYLAYVREGGWRSLELMTEEQVGRLLEALGRALPVLAGGGTLVDREPWHLVRGGKER